MFHFPDGIQFSFFPNSRRSDPRKFKVASSGPAIRRSHFEFPWIAPSRIGEEGELDSVWEVEHVMGHRFSAFGIRSGRKPLGLEASSVHFARGRRSSTARDASRTDTR